MSKSVLIISNSGDIHTDLLVEACERKKFICFRYNTNEFRCHGNIVWNVNGNCLLKLGDRECVISDVDLLFYRRPIAVHRGRKDIEPWVGVTLDAEWDTVEKAISYGIKGKVINPVGAVAIAQNKIAQLQLANRLGILTPPTIISTDIVELKKFLGQHQCITKAIGNGNYIVDGVTRIGKADEMSKYDLEGYDGNGCSTLLQKRIIPYAMWRIITVGEQSYGFRLIGHALSEDVDSRFVEEKLSGEYLPVPTQIKEKLKAMCNGFSLLYASTDFIEDDRGQLWFLDLNPEGQWGAYEKRFSVPISEYLIDLA